MMKRPDYETSFKAKAVEYIKRGKYKEALYYLKKLDPTDLNVQTLKSSCYIATKKYDKAEKVLLKVVKKTPRDVEVLRNFAIVYYYKGKTNREVHYFKKIIEITKKKKVMDQTSELATVHGIEYYMKGEKEKAELLFNVALEADPKNEVSLYNLAIIANEREDFDRSTSFLERLLSFNKKHIDALMTLGGINFNEKQYNKAIQYFKQAAKHASKEEEKYRAQLFIGRSYFNGEEYREAEKAFMTAWETKKDDSDLVSLILITWQRLFNKFKEEKYAVRILEFLILKEDKREAIQFLEHALAEVPDSKDLKRFKEVLQPDEGGNSNA
ncbi:MAG: tetratricopeptide repeat protein [Candidatus Odinarchaeota archaeon]